MGPAGHRRRPADIRRFDGSPPHAPPAGPVVKADPPGRAGRPSRTVARTDAHPRGRRRPHRGLASVELVRDQLEGRTDGVIGRRRGRSRRCCRCHRPSSPGRLLLDEVWLSGVVDLLRQRHQIVLYGPPGTGKTHLAMRLAERLAPAAGSDARAAASGLLVRGLVEGFRPETTEDGPERMRLRAGPLRRLADEARDAPSHALHPDHRRD